MGVGAYGSMGVKISLHPHMDTPIHPYFLPEGGDLYRGLDLLGWWVSGIFIRKGVHTTTPDPSLAKEGSYTVAWTIWVVEV